MSTTEGHRNSKEEAYPSGRTWDTPVFLAKRATPENSCIYLACDIKKEGFTEYSCLVLNRVL